MYYIGLGFHYGAKSVASLYESSIWSLYNFHSCNLNQAWLWPSKVGQGVQEDKSILMCIWKYTGRYTSTVLDLSTTVWANKISSHHPGNLPDATMGLVLTFFNYAYALEFIYFLKMLQMLP